MKPTINITVRNIDRKEWARLKADATIEGKTLTRKLNEVLRDRELEK